MSEPVFLQIEIPEDIDPELKTMAMLSNLLEACESDYRLGDVQIERILTWFKEKHEV